MDMDTDMGSGMTTDIKYLCSFSWSCSFNMKMNKNMNMKMDIDTDMGIGITTHKDTEALPDILEKNVLLIN
jgi:hypothetical protein